MGILADHQIYQFVKITPYDNGHHKPGVISYGLSSYGYDIRVGNKFKILTNTYNTVIDPKNVDPRIFTDVEGDYCLIPPNGFALAESVEHFDISPDVIGLFVGKSTYARCAVVVGITPLEPGWRGKITIELSNNAPLPVKIYANEGIGQILFIRGDEPCLTTYERKNGKYQDQEGITLPIVK